MIMLSYEQIKKIGREYGKIGPTALSKELGVSKQRIEQIAKKLRNRGVPIPKVRIRNEQLDIIAEELKREWQINNL